MSAALCTRTTSAPAGGGTVDGGDQRDLGASGDGFLGQGVALLARRTIGDHAHRVDGLAGTAGRDQHPHTVEVLRGQDPLDRGDDGVGIGEPPDAGVTTGEAAGLGRHDDHAPLGEHVEVVLHRRVLPHLGVHGRADHHRRPSWPAAWR